ncbi:hypothetical protein B4U80_11994, partial [Leptotrombidium deliense]
MNAVIHIASCHNNERRYKCNLCGMKYARQWNLKKHMKDKHTVGKLTNTNGQTIKKNQLNDVWRNMWSKDVKITEEKILNEIDIHIMEIFKKGVKKYRYTSATYDIKETETIEETNHEKVTSNELQQNVLQNKQFKIYKDTDTKEEMDSEQSTSEENQ